MALTKDREKLRRPPAGRAGVVPDVASRANARAPTRRFGTQGLQRLICARLLHARLTVSQPDDASEQQADCVADAETKHGRHLLAHELTHVIQQSGGVSRSRAGIQRKPMAEATIDGTFNAYYAKTKNIDSALAETRRQIGPSVPASYVPPPRRVVPAVPPVASPVPAAPAGSSPVSPDVAPDLPEGVPPVARYVPTPGIVAERVGKKIQITGSMELYGPEAAPARATSVQDSINKNWTQSFPDGYSVSCRVTVTHRATGSPGVAAQILAEKSDEASHVSRKGKLMTLNANEPDAFDWTAAHEFGHVIRLEDQYTESLLSQALGRINSKYRTTEAKEGYKGNMMADVGGVVEAKNVQDISKESIPWNEDDDQVRDWVRARSATELASLATAIKIRILATLMGGNIEPSDLEVMIAVCSSVSQRAEANAIRDAIKLSGLSDLGQHTKLRLAFDSMP